LQGRDPSRLKDDRIILSEACIIQVREVLDLLILYTRYLSNKSFLNLNPSVFLSSGFLLHPSSAAEYTKVVARGWMALLHTLYNSFYPCSPKNTHKWRQSFRIQSFKSLKEKEEKVQWKACVPSEKLVLFNSHLLNEWTCALQMGYCFNLLKVPSRGEVPSSREIRA